MGHWWSILFGTISDPLTFEVIYLVKYFSSFIYFTSHATKKQLKKAATSKDMYCHICQRLPGIISWFLFQLQPAWASPPGTRNFPTMSSKIGLTKPWNV